MIVVELSISGNTSKECSEYLFELVLLTVPLSVLSLWPVLRGSVLFRTIAVIGGFFLWVDESGVGITNFFEYIFGTLIG